MAIYDAIGGVISSLINANSQKKSNAAYLQGINDTNAANLAIQRETNKQNLDMFNAANAFSERMWNLENSYNSPVAQRARMIQAGINPSDISAGAASSVQSTAGVPAQSAKMNAPGQMPIPDYGSAFRALGGSVREFKENQLLDEQIKQSRLATSMKETDRAFYYGEKERRARKEAADILGQDYKNESDWIRLQDLNDEINHLRVMRNKSERAADDEHDLAIKRGEQIDVDISKTLDDIRHMQESDRIAWFNAKTNASLTKAEIDKLKSEKQMQDILNEIKNMTKFDEAAGVQIERQLLGFDLQHKQALIYQMLADNEIRRRLNSSGFRYFINRYFGIDLQSLFSGFAGASVGSAARIFMPK